MDMLSAKENEIIENRKAKKNLWRIFRQSLIDTSTLTLICELVVFPCVIFIGWLIYKYGVESSPTIMALATFCAPFIIAVAGRKAYTQGEWIKAKNGNGGGNG